MIFKCRPHAYDVTYKTPWIKQVGGIPRDDRFKYHRREKMLQELSPGPTTATPADSIILPRITSIGKYY
jgi:hypothetical protein